MSDPVAQAAAQIAADAAPSSTEPSMLDRAMETIHTLEAKVEHLIHPDAPGNVVAGAADSAAAASASTAETSPASMTSITPEPSSGEAPNAVATPPAGAAMPASTGNVLLNAAPVVDEGNVQSAATASSPLPNSTPFAQSSPEKSTENSALAPAATGNVLLNASPTVDVPVLEAGGAEMGELDAKASAGSPVNVANAAQTAAAALAGTAEASASTAPIATTLKTSDPLPRESHLMLLEAKISAVRTKLANAERVALVEFEAIVGHIKAVL
jgi:hypothetical protein